MLGLLVNDCLKAILMGRILKRRSGRERRSRDETDIEMCRQVWSKTQLYFVSYVKPSIKSIKCLKPLSVHTTLQSMMNTKLSKQKL